MRLMFSSFLAVLVLPLTSFAQSGNTWRESLAGVGATAGHNVNSRDHTVQFNFSSTPSVCTSRLEGSLTGGVNDWNDLSGTLPCVPTTYPYVQQYSIGTKTNTYVRVVILTYTGSGSIAVSYRGERAGG